MPCASAIVQYEQRVVDIVLETKNLPETLAMTGALEIRCALKNQACVGRRVGIGVVVRVCVLLE